MLTADWEHKLKTEKSVVKERNLVVTPKEYLELKKYMINQDKNHDIHILSMDYGVTTGKLKLVERHFIRQKHWYKLW